MKTKDECVMFQPNTRVKLVKCYSQRTSDHTGKLGKVVENLCSLYGKIAVRLDNEENPRGGWGLFYFRPDELSPVHNNNDILEENIMQNITGYLNLVKIQYLDNATASRHIYANFDSFLTKGDLCVVKSAHHGLGLAKVVDVISDADPRNVQVTREIVAKVDTQDYDYRVAVRKDAAELKAKMQERAKQLQDIALYQMLAKDDPEMQELLDRYQGLPKM